MLLNILNYMRGNIRISIRGACIERFLNVCAANHIDFWAVRRVSDDTMHATVRIGGFFRLRHLARRCMCRIRVVKKRGMPFAVKKYSRRYALWGGALACAALLWVLSGFVWTIEIAGCETLAPADIAYALEQYGVRPGVLRASIDPDEIKNLMLLDNEKLSFFAVNLKGCHAQIVLRERDAMPDIIDRDAPCDIVCDKTGVIHKLGILAGTTTLKVGQTVEPGDKIASGTMVSTQGYTWYVHAVANVELRTWHTIKLMLAADIDAPQPTGRTVTRRALVIGSTRRNLYFVESIPFACYDKEVKRQTLTVGEQFRLPVTLVTETYTEIERQPIELSEQKCAELLEQRALDMLARNLPDARILTHTFDFAMTDGRVVGTLQTECLEPAGVEVAIAPGLPQEQTPAG